MFVNFILTFFFIIIIYLLLKNTTDKAQKLLIVLITLSVIIGYCIYTISDLYKLRQVRLHTIFQIFTFTLAFVLFQKSNTIQRHLMLSIVFNILLYWYLQFEFLMNFSKILVFLFIIIIMMYFISRLSKTQKIKILIINECFLIICLSMFIVDFSRIQYQQEPIFYYKSVGIQDGGTIVYSSLGYTIYKFQNLVDYEQFEPIYICTFRENYSEILNKIFQ